MIVIVSGLPRSGTSMMMQMLAAGGLPPLTDELRVADTDNPRGYFEFEPVKQTARDAAWLDRAEGRAVKLVSMLLFDLPPGRDYRVILMRRDLDEVLASQAAMLRRRGQPRGAGDREMKRRFAEHLAKVDAWFSGRSDVRRMDVDYAEACASPADVAGRIADFLGLPLDRAAMAATVAPELHRQQTRCAWWRSLLGR